MTTSVVRLFHGVHCLSSSELSADDARLICERFQCGHALDEEKEGEGRGVFEGRGSIEKFVVSGKNYVVLRRYLRGGAVRHMVKSRFVYPLQGGVSSIRSVREFHDLSSLYDAGVSVVKPVCALYQRSVLSYEAALVTKEVIGAVTFASLIVSHAQKNSSSSVFDIQLATYAFLAGVESRKALECGIQHVDLHPGNILCISSQVRLIDFDKSKRVDTRKLKEALRAIYSRWKRAVDKMDISQGTARQLEACFKKGLLQGKKQKSDGQERGYGRAA